MAKSRQSEEVVKLFHSFLVPLLLLLGVELGGVLRFVVLE